MKKNIIIISCLLLVLLLSLTACSQKKNLNSNEKNNVKVDDVVASKIATVIKRNGEIEEMTSKMLCDVYDKNEAKFKKDYVGSNIIFVGTVSNVKSYLKENGSPILLDSIHFKEGFVLYLPYNYYDIAELDVGDLLYINTNIYSGFGCIGGLNIRGTGMSEGYNEESLKETLIKKMNGVKSSELNNYKLLFSEEKKLYYSLELIKSKMTFGKKYAANGKVGDSFLQELEKSLDNSIDYELLEKYHNGIIETLDTIKDANNVFIKLYNDYSSQNVQLITQISEKNGLLVEELMNLFSNFDINWKI